MVHVHINGYYYYTLMQTHCVFGTNLQRYFTFRYMCVCGAGIIAPDFQLKGILIRTIGTLITRMYVHEN